MYKQPEYTCEFINLIHALLKEAVQKSVKNWSLYRNPQYASVPPPSIILVATVAAPVVIMSVSASAIMVTVAAPVALVLIVVPVVLHVTPRTGLVPVALASGAAVGVGRMMPVGAAVLLSRVSTWGRLPLLSLGEVQLLGLPHHVVHLQMEREDS